jgi:hypothetical protein
MLYILLLHDAILIRFFCYRTKKLTDLYVFLDTRLIRLTNKSFSKEPINLRRPTAQPVKPDPDYRCS